MSFSRSARRGATLTLAVGAALALAPVTAHASGPSGPSGGDGTVTAAAAKKKSNFDKSRNGTRAKGWVGWHDGLTNDKAEWKIDVLDVQTGKWCAQARVVVDRPGNDKEYTSKKVCGKGKKYTWKHKTGSVAFLRGVKIQLCRNLPVSNSYQKCDRVHYIKNPFYAY
ncbi:hypothetical protein GCM10009678_76450 [Actinomadura kijaniata]|uniref:Secreted protein n=1 Tax=Actinomadura namibiensis TaxID=182080 RepID=A0A7W3LW72_ACTNM|nr:hypothetical protein [Actinomadura namibiensis]MBA8955386.1 hypothetical protein [Actinomadura namibiensis]